VECWREGSMERLGESKGLIYRGAGNIVFLNEMAS
jgi:hypothetical protein